MSDESESNKTSKVIEDNLNRLNKCIKYLESSHTEISTQFNTLANQGSNDNAEWETVLNFFKKGCDIAARQLADIQKNFGDNIANQVSDKHLISTSKSKDGSSKNDDTNTKKNLKNREVTKDIEISNATKENISNQVSNISGSRNIEDDFNKENCPIIQSGKNDELGNELQKNCTSLKGDNVSAEKNCDENHSENATENGADLIHEKSNNGGEVEPIPSKIGIRLVAIEKLLDPNIAARSKELNITQPIVNNNANSSIIILDSDDDDVVTAPAFATVIPFSSFPLVPPLTHITSSSHVRTGIREKTAKNATKRKRTKERNNKLKRVAVKIKRSRIIAQLIKNNKQSIVISKSLAKKLNAIVLDNKLVTSLTTSKKASNREKVKSTTINKGPERVHSSNDDLEKRTNSNKSSEKVLLEKRAKSKNMEIENSDDTSTTKEYTVGPRSRRKLKKKTQSKNIPTPSCSGSSEDERAPKNKQENKTNKNGADSNTNVEKHKHKKKHVRSAKIIDSSDEEKTNTTKENKPLKSSEKSSKLSEIGEKEVNRCESVAKNSSNLEQKNQNEKNDDKEKDTSDCNDSIKNDEKSAKSKKGDKLDSSDRDTEGNSPPKKIKISSDNKSSSKIKSSEMKSKSFKDKPANISNIDSLVTESIKTSSSKEKGKKSTDVKTFSSQNKSDENKSLQKSSKNKSAKSSDTDSSDNESMRSTSAKEKTKKNTDIKASSSENKTKESKSQSARAKSANISDTDSSDDENMRTKSSKEKTKQDKSEESKSQSSSKSSKSSEADSSNDESKKSKSSKEKTKKENSKENKCKSSKDKSGKTSDIDSSNTESIRSKSSKKKTKDKEDIKSNSSKSKSDESKSQSSSNVEAANTAVTNSSNNEGMRSSSPAKETMKNTDNKSSSSKSQSQSSSETKNTYNSDSDSSDSSEFTSNKKTHKKDVDSVSSTENDDELNTKSRSRSKSKQSDDSSDTESIKNSSSQEKMKSSNLANSDDEDQESKESLADKNESDKESSKNSDEDIDSSDSEIINTKKRKRAKSQSNSSKSSDEDTKTAEKKKRKRKIIRHDDSDSNNSESNSPSTRKNIRKILKKKDLDDDTKKAAKEEEQRRKRIEERQKLYNSIYEKPQSTEIEELVLDFDAETKEKLLEVDKGLLKKLKPHQANGVKFMWDACFETIKDAGEKPGSGCILGHCMGLGKTLQIITLTHTLLTNSRKTGVERVLVITPLSTLTNWAKEYKQWMKYCKKKDVEIYDMSRWRERNLRISKLNEWFEEGGVCIIGYDMFRILSNPKSAGVPKKKKPLVQKALIDPGPDIVICDEGHLLKNEKTTISQAVNKLRTQRRIVLTGTPLQNNLKEYYCMIQFIKPNLLGTYKEYLNRFVNPITNGQYTDSTARDIQLMKNRAHILHKLLEGCIQRRDYSVLAPYLPPKHEYVVYISCSEMQKKLYEFYMTEQRNIISESSTGGKGAMLFQDLQNLRRIWTHPMSLRLNSDTVIKKKIAKDISDSEGSLKDFIDDNDESSSSSSSSSSSDSSDSESDAGKKALPKRGTRRTRGNIDPVECLEVPRIERSEDPSEWWMPHCPEPELNNINHSPKLVLLMNVLERCEAIGDKVLVFSQSLQSLDVIENFLSLIDKKTEGEEIEGDVGEFEGTWAPGIDYFRLDGSSSVDQREAMCNAFNDVKNLRARLFLISTRAGSLGINLVAANRVIIFDVSWNPSHDTQSIFRVYRFGQTKPCYIYRFIAMGTMEQKVYERQVAKQATAKRVLDEQQIGRHYNQNDLLELYKYELAPTEARETPILPKDRLFAELLSKFEKLIYKYHEHDSLLENEESENLTEEERKAAWAEYEAEKERPAQQFVAYNRQNVGNGPVTSSKIFGLRTDVLLQLLNMKVSQDHPNLNDTERIRLVPSYLSQLYAEMNVGNTSLYRELIHLSAALQMPYMYNQGMAPPMVGINPFAYGNAGQMAPHSEMQMNNPPTTDSQIYEID